MIFYYENSRLKRTMQNTYSFFITILFVDKANNTSKNRRECIFWMNTYSCPLQVITAVIKIINDKGPVLLLKLAILATSPAWY